MKCLQAHPSLMTTGGGCGPDSSRMVTGLQLSSQYTGHLCLPSAALLPLLLTHTYTHAHTHTHTHTHRHTAIGATRAGGQGDGARRGGNGGDGGPSLIVAPNKSYHCACLYPTRSFVKQCQIMSNTVTQWHALLACSVLEAKLWSACVFPQSASALTSRTNRAWERLV